MNERIRQEIDSQIRGNLAGLINAGVMKQVLLDMVSAIEKGTVVEIYTSGESDYTATVDYQDWDDYQVFAVDDELVWKVAGDIDEGYRFETATYTYRFDGAGYTRNTKKTIDQAEQNAKTYSDQRLATVSGSLTQTDQNLQNQINQNNSGSIQRDQQIAQDLASEVTNRESAVDSLKEWVIANYPNNTTVEATYYRSGSNANLGNSATDNLLVRGNLTVEGSIVQTHEEDVQIKDKFVEIASGSRNPDEANGAGFAIMGASASMVYNSADDTLEFNKEIVAPYFHGTASVASDIQDDGVIATALADMYNRVTPMVTSGSLDSSTYTLSGQAVKTIDSQTNSSYSTVTIATPRQAAVGFEHSLFLKVTRSTTVSLGSIPRPSGSSASVSLTNGQTLAMTWTYTPTGCVITDLQKIS